MSEWKKWQVKVPGSKIPFILFINFLWKCYGLIFLSVTSLFIFAFHFSLFFSKLKKIHFFPQVQNSLIPLFCFSQASTLPPFTRVKRGWLTTLTNWPIRRREFSHTINSAIFNLWPILIKTSPSGGRDLISGVRDDNFKVTWLS